MDTVGPRGRVVEPGLRAHADEPLDLRADVVGRRRALREGCIPRVGDRRDALHERPEAFLGLGGARLGLDALGDIEHHALSERRPPASVRSVVVGFVVDPSHRTVRARDAVLVEVGRRVTVGLRGDRADPLEVVGVDLPRPVRGVFVGGHAEEVLDLRADEQVPAVRRVPAVRDHRRLDAVTAKRRLEQWYTRPPALRWGDWSAHNSVTRAAWERLDHGFDPRFVARSGGAGVGAATAPGRRHPVRRARHRGGRPRRPAARTGRPVDPHHPEGSELALERRAPEPPAPADQLRSG